VVHDVADVLESEQPRFGRTVMKVHEPFHVLLDVTPSMLRKVLMLVMSFAMPIINAEGAEHVFGAVG